MADFFVNIASAGSEKVNADLNKILKAANATSGSITALAQVLNTSANSAAAFANKIGLSATATNAAIAKYRALKDAGVDNANIFKALNQELGINATQYKNLVLGIKDVDRQTAAYNARLKTLADAQDAAKQSAEDQLRALEQINQAARQVQQALGAFAQQAVSEFIQFDDALTSVSAKSGIAKDQLGFLADAAQEVALATSQSPASAIRAADSLIALGASAQEAADRLAVTAQLTDALRTAGATIEQSAKVVQLGVGIYEKLGVTVEDVGNKIAVLSDTTAAASSTGLNEFLQLFSKAGGLAAQLGISMDELLAAFGELRDAGQAPEVAATSLKSLISETLSSRDKLEELGITVFKVGADGTEKFVGLANIMQQIGEKGLSTTQIVDIFGKIGVASAVALSENYQSVNDRIVQLSGTTDELAQKSAAINSSIAGQIKLLEGSYQTALKDIGESLGSFASPAVQATTALINAFINADPFIKNFVGGIVGIGAGLSSVVVALTGFGLALKAMEVAQVGTTIKTIAATVANAQYTISANAAAIANAGLGKSFAVASVGAINLTQGVAAAGVAAGKAALAYVPLALAIAGVAATAQIVAKTFEAVDADAAQARQSTEGVTSALNKYRESVGLSSVETATASEQLSVIDSIFKLLKDAIDNVTLALEFVRENIEPFVNGIVNGVGFAADAFADFIDVIPGVPDALVSALRSAAQGFKDFDFATATEAQASRTEVAFDNLITNVNQLQDEYIALTQQGVKPGSEAALALAGALRVAADELAKQQGLNEADAAQRDALVKTIGFQILALQGSTQAQDDAGDSAEDLADAIGEIEKAYDAAIAALDQDIAAKLIAVNEDVTLSAEQREAAIADIEKQGALDRIAILEQFIAQRKALTGLEKEEAQANAEAIVELESEVSNIRLDISEKEAKRREEIENERIAKEQALRQAAYDEEVRQIEALKNQAELAANDRINAQNAILESLDDQSTAISNQQSLLELQLSTQQTISDARIARLDEEINALGNASGLIDAINSKELSKEQLLLAQNELRRLGLDSQSSEAEILEAIRIKTEEKNDAEVQALKDKQEGERALLELNQEQERLELLRLLTQAKIAEIEAQSLVVQSQLNAKAEERLLNFNKMELAAAKAAGASDAELIALQGKVDAQADALSLAQSQIPLAQTGADLAAQQVADAQDAVVAGEKLFDAQDRNLKAAQAAELAAFNTAEDGERLADALGGTGGAADGANATADGLERAATASERLAQEAQRVSYELGQSIQLLNNQTKIQNAEQGKILASLDAQSESLAQQKSILENQLETQQLLANGRIDQIESEIQGLESASELIEAIKSGEIDREESLLAQQELRRLGLTDQSTEVEIAELLKQKKEEQRQIEIDALESKQAAEKSILQLQQAQEKVALQRQLTQAKIEESEARSLAIQAQLKIKAEERLLTLKQQELSAARSEEASEQQLASLERAVQSQKVSLEIAKAELPLVQEQARLASQQVSDAKAAIIAADQLFQSQAQQLAIAQGLEKSRLESAQNAERLAEAMQKSAEDTDNLNKSLISLYDRIKVVKDEIKSLTPDDEGYEKLLQDLERLEQRRILLIYQYRVDELSNVLEISKGVLEKSLADIEYQYAQQLTTEDEYNQSRLDAQKGFLDQQIEIKNREIELLGREREDQSQALLELTNLETERIKLLRQFRVEQLEEVLSDSKLVIDNSLSEIENQYAQGLVNEEQYNQRRLEIQLQSLSDQIDIKNQELALYAEGSDEQTQLLTELRNLETERINVLEEFRVNQLKNVLENSQSIIEEYELQDDLDAVNEKTVELLERQNSLFKLEQEREALLREQRLVQLDQELENLKEGEALLHKINDREFNREQIILAQNRLREIGIDFDISAEALASKRLDILEEQIVAERENFEQQQAAQVAQLQVAQELERIGLRRQAIEAEIARLQAANTLALAEQSGIESLVQTAERSLEAAEQLVAAVDETLAYFDATAAKQLENLLLTQQLADAQRDAADEAERFAIAIERAEGTGTFVTTQTERRSSIPGRASGGPVSAGKPYIVGEEGPELIVPKRSGTVIPNKKLKKLQEVQDSFEKYSHIALFGNPNMRFAKGFLSDLQREALLHVTNDYQIGGTDIQSIQDAAKALENLGVDVRKIGSREDPKEFVRLIKDVNEDFVQFLRDSEKTFHGLKNAFAAYRSITPIRKTGFIPSLEQREGSPSAEISAIKSGSAATYSQLESISKRALGGPVSAGMPYIVGERRPELFVPRVPGTIVPRVPQSFGGGSLAKVESLLAQLVARPVPVVNAPATFINQPNPLQTQIELLQGQLRAARGAF